MYTMSFITVCGLIDDKFLRKKRRWLEERGLVFQVGRYEMIYICSSSVFTSLVAPEHVLEGSLVEMVIDVVESVLGDIANAKLGCFQISSPLLGSISPIRSLTRVDFPKLLGPRTATQEKSET